MCDKVLNEMAVQNSARWICSEACDRRYWLRRRMQACMHSLCSKLAEGVGLIRELQKLYSVV